MLSQHLFCAHNINCDCNIWAIHGKFPIERSEPNNDYQSKSLSRGDKDAAELGFG